MKKLFLLFFMLCFGLSVMAQTSLYVGQSTILSAPDVPSGSAINQTAWSCTNSHVSVENYTNYGAKVTVNSYFTGTAEIRCDYYYYWYDYAGYMHTNNGKTYFYITCNPVTLSISPTWMQLHPGEGQTISYSYSPSNVSPKPTIRFFTNNDNVATVSSSGYVKAIGAGKTTITVENSSGPDETCEVTVVKIDPTSITFDKSSVSVTEGQTKTLSYTLSPSGSSASVTWSSSDESVVKVSSKGEITGVKEGKATIKVVTDNNLFATCDVTVVAAPKSVSLPANKQVVKGYTIQLTPTLTPENSESTYTWKSADTSIASVNAQGVVTGKKAGTTTITVTTVNGLTANCQISVADAPEGLDSRNVKARIDAVKSLAEESIMYIK